MQDGRTLVTPACPTPGRMTGVRARLIVCCLGLVAAGAGCASNSVPHAHLQATEVRPSQAVPQTRMPARPLAFGQYQVQGSRICRTRVLGAEYRDSQTHQSTAVPAVSTDLVGATAFWLPGAQGTPCRSVRTAIPAASARTVAALVNGAGPLPAGQMSCGGGDGTQVWLYLRPTHARGVQKLILTPDGCLTVGADGLWPRRLPVAVMRTLAPYAPPGWTAYLDNGV
jgi:hypothetical protein